MGFDATPLRICDKDDIHQLMATTPVGIFILLLTAHFQLTPYVCRGSRHAWGFS